MSPTFEVFTGVSVLLILGAAWARVEHRLTVVEMLSRTRHRDREDLERRMQWLEKWLPPRSQEHKADDRS